MRKFVLLILVFAFLLLSGCSHSTAGTAPAATPSVGVPSPDQTTEPAPSSSEDQAAEPTPSPSADQTKNTSADPASTDVASASKAYQKLLSGDFSDVRAKAGVTDTGEDYARQYAPFYSARPDENKWEYTLVDMDGDGIPELFIRLVTSPDITAIFHWASDGTICWEFDTVEATSYYTPLENGMIWSKYKSSNNIYKVDNSGSFNLVLEFTQENKDECEAYIAEKLSTRVIQPEHWYNATNMTPLQKIA